MDKQGKASLAQMNNIDEALNEDIDNEFEDDDSAALNNMEDGQDEDMNEDGDEDEEDEDEEKPKAIAEGDVKTQAPVAKAQ